MSFCQLLFLILIIVLIDQIVHSIIIRDAKESTVINIKLNYIISQHLIYYDHTVMHEVDLLSPPLRSRIDVPTASTTYVFMSWEC